MQVLTTAPDPLSPQVNATEAATIPVRALGLHASAHYGARPPFPTAERDRGGDDERGGEDDGGSGGVQRQARWRWGRWGRQRRRRRRRRQLASRGGTLARLASNGQSACMQVLTTAPVPLSPQVRLHVSLPTGNRPACKCSLRRPTPFPTGTLARLAPNGQSACMQVLTTAPLPPPHRYACTSRSQRAIRIKR